MPSTPKSFDSVAFRPVRWPGLMLAALTLFAGTAAAILGLFSLLEEEGLQCAIRIAAERRDSAKGMTLPATRRVILCGMRGSRTPQRSNEVAKTVSGCQMQASSS